MATKITNLPDRRVRRDTDEHARRCAATILCRCDGGLAVFFEISSHAFSVVFCIVQTLVHAGLVLQPFVIPALHDAAAIRTRISSAVISVDGRCAITIVVHRPAPLGSA